jgi:hypothetical protein
VEKSRRQYLISGSVYNSGGVSTQLHLFEPLIQHYHEAHKRNHAQTPGVPNIPPYAILSHIWEEEEVSFQEMSRFNHDVTLEDKKGYKKIKGCCELARKDGYDWVWVDTCCIDKSSSAELSESINSMFRWYKNAQVCYAYLADVPLKHPLEARLRHLVFPDTHPEMAPFFKSRWFTRGWTLQELIAPFDLHLFSSGWDQLGTKHSLCDMIERITGISTEVLIIGDISTQSVAQRMCWASSRSTTRVEDVAYSLLVF